MVSVYVALVPAVTVAGPAAVTAMSVEGSVQALTIRFASGEPLPVTRSYPGPQFNGGVPVLPPVVMSWKSVAGNE